jgi:hypothetical protein
MDQAADDDTIINLKFPKIVLSNDYSNLIKIEKNHHSKKLKKFLLMIL